MRTVERIRFLPFGVGAGGRRPRREALARAEDFAFEVNFKASVKRPERLLFD